MAEFRLTEKRAEQERAVLRVADIVRRKLDGVIASFDKDDHPDGEQKLGVLRRALEQLDQELAVYLYLRKEERESAE